MSHTPISDRRAWSPDDDSALRAHWAGPLSNHDIGQAIGRSGEAVEWRGRKLSLGRRSPTTVWPQERIDLLTNLWSLGRTGTEIAKLMPGLTRAAVIGKVHRLNLPERPSDAQRKARGAELKAKRERRKAAGDSRPLAATLHQLGRQKEAGHGRFRAPRETPLLTVIEAALNPKTLIEIAQIELPGSGVRCCRWGVGEHPPAGEMHRQLFCADPAMTSEPYCEAHKRRSLQKTRSAAQKKADVDRAREMRAAHGSKKPSAFNDHSFLFAELRAANG